jgi:hypothetical protein
MLNIEEINLVMNKKPKLENLSKIYGINTSSFLLLKKKYWSKLYIKKIIHKGNTT